MNSLVQDLRYGFRMLVKSPGFTTIAVLSLALGIGANTAIFSLIDAVLLRMVPVMEPEKLLVLGGAGSRGGVGYSFTYPTYRQLVEHNQSFTALAAYSPATVSVSIDGNIEPSTSAQLVSGDYFSLLGVNAVIGRTFTPDDNRVPGGHPVAMISYGYWKRRFARDPAVIGKSIEVSGTPFTIIGVTPPEFFGLEVGRSPDLTFPFMMQPQVMPATDSFITEEHAVYNWLRLFGRLKPGVGEPQALAATGVVYKEVCERYAAAFMNGKPGAAQFWREQRLVIEPGSRGLSDLRRQFSKPLLILMTVVGLVLLIACANIANLLLARAAKRRREIAVRLAIGAGRWRLIRQLLVESVLLAMVGGMAGVVFAFWGSRLLVAFLSSGRGAIILDLTPDLRLLGFTAVISLVTGVLFGLAPAFRATRVDLTPALKGDAADHATGSPRLRLGKVLVVSQVALSLLLLIGAGLFVRSLRKLVSQDLGFSQDNVLVVRVEPKGSDQKWPNRARLVTVYRDLLDRVHSIPGVRSASLAGFGPLTHSGFGGPVSVPGYTPQAGEDSSVRMTQIYPRYFETLGISLIAGRDLTDADMPENAPKVAIINETMARRFFPNQNPLGRGIGRVRGPELYQIIGVVKDAKFAGLREKMQPLAYMPYLQTPTGRGQMTLHVRVTGNPAGVASAVRQTVHSLDREMPLFEIQTLATQIDALLIQERLMATLSSFFGLLALLLASIGLFGIMSYAVARRTSEIGIRVALGARPGRVMWLVQRESLLLVAIGITLGIPVAIASTRVISTFLFGMSPSDPTTIALATAMLLAVAAIAGYIPARRASRIDPIVALRFE